MVPVCCPHTIDVMWWYRVSSQWKEWAHPTSCMSQSKLQTLTWFIEVSPSVLQSRVTWTLCKRQPVTMVTPHRGGDGLKMPRRRKNIEQKSDTKVSGTLKCRWFVWTKTKMKWLNICQIWSEFSSIAWSCPAFWWWTGGVQHVLRISQCIRLQLNQNNKSADPKAKTTVWKIIKRSKGLTTVELLSIKICLVQLFSCDQ